MLRKLWRWLSGWRFVVLSVSGDGIHIKLPLRYRFRRTYIDIVGLDGVTLRKRV